MNVVCYSRDWRFTVSEHGKEEKIKQREITGNLRNNATIFFIVFGTMKRGWICMLGPTCLTNMPYQPVLHLYQI